MGKRWIACGSLLAALAVAIGAFGAHGLEDRLDADMLETYHTGAQYQMYHALGLILLGAVMKRPSGLARWSGILFLIGIVCFSGSLYILSLSGVKAWGAVAPIGGASFIAGWVLLALAALKQSENRE
ncbi:DUF423 domain-containing protein [Marinicrinis lubricantis]|uniref:DUF423 domain-containing protein n=1 Tax=Marinicrinis lubricantis TaxID=2086470 RepID=A0ABW1IH33_9BACL